MGSSSSKTEDAARAIADYIVIKCVVRNNKQNENLINQPFQVAKEAYNKVDKTNSSNLKQMILEHIETKRKILKQKQQTMQAEYDILVVKKQEVEQMLQCLENPPDPNSIFTGSGPNKSKTK